PPGVHGLPGREPQLRRVAEGGGGGLPIAEEGPEAAAARLRGGGRGRFRASAGLQRGGAGAGGQRHRGSRLPPWRGRRSGPRRGGQRALQDRKSVVLGKEGSGLRI